MKFARHKLTVDDVNKSTRNSNRVIDPIVKNTTICVRLHASRDRGGWHQKYSLRSDANVQPAADTPKPSSDKLAYV